MSNPDIKSHDQEGRLGLLTSKLEKHDLYGPVGREVLREATESKCGIMAFYNKEYRATDGEDIKCEGGDFFMTDLGEKGRDIQIKIDPKDVVTTIIVDLTFTAPVPIDPKGELWFSCTYHVDSATGEVKKITQSTLFSNEKEDVENKKIESTNEEVRAALKEASQRSVVGGRDLGVVDNDISGIRDRVEPCLTIDNLRTYARERGTDDLELETNFPKWLTEDADIPSLDDPDMPFILLEKFGKGTEATA